jgi:hypothetical protein
VGKLLANIFAWRLLKENHEKQVEFMRWWMGWQRSHPDKFYYARSRIFTLAEEGPEENWIMVDEYAHREDFDRQWKAAREDPELAKVLKDAKTRWDTLIVLGSRRKGEVWTELEELTVEFRK